MKRVRILKRKDNKKMKQNVQRNISTILETNTSTSEVNKFLDRIMDCSNFHRIIAITPINYGNNIAYVIDYETINC